MEFTSDGNGFLRRTSPRASGDECPAVVVADVARRPRPEATIIAFGNEKGGVGKSTLAFHTAVALAYRGHAVLAIDLDRRQQSLARSFEKRGATARALRKRLPQPRYTVLHHQSTEQLLAEARRIAPQADVIIIDCPGADTAMERRAIALADVLVTPVNNSFTDLDALGRMRMGGMSLATASPFAELVADIRTARTAARMRPLDWLVVKNRVRHCEKRLEARVDTTLASMARKLGFRISPGITERVAYRELLPFGLSYADARFVPELGALRSASCIEMAQLADSLRLPPLRGPAPPPRPEQARLGNRAQRDFGRSLSSHFAKDEIAEHYG